MEAMIIFLYGPDSYRRRIKEKEIIANYRGKHSVMAFETFDLVEDGEWPRLRDFISAQSLFSSMKMAVVRFAIADDTEKDIHALLQTQKENKDTHLLLTSDTRPLKKFSFLLEPPVIKREFPLLSGAAWQEFLDGEIKRIGLRLDPRARAIVADAYLGNCWGAVNELERLALCDTARSADQLLAVANLRVAKDFFGMLRGLESGSVEHRVVALETALAQDDPAKIFNILAYSVSGEHQRRMADSDVAIKMGKLEYAEALLDLVL